MKTPRNKKAKEIMTVKEIAQYLGVHPLTVQRYAREGEIPAFKIGSDWRFHAKYIQKWIKRNMSRNLESKKQQKTIF